MNKPKIFGIIVVVLAFAITSFVFNNCGRSRYQGPTNTPPTIVDDESFLNGDPVQVSGNVSTLSSDSGNIVGQGFVCIPSFTEQPQVRVNRKYFNGSTSVTERIGSSLYIADLTYAGPDVNCGGTPYSFNLSIPMTQFESGGLSISDTSVSDQVFYVETFIPGNVLTGGEDLYIPLPGSVYIPNGLSSGYHTLSGQTETRYVWYDDITFLIDDDPSTLAEVYYCVITETNIVSNVFQTPAGVFQEISTITETNCPDFIINPGGGGGGGGGGLPVACVGDDNIGHHYVFDEKTYIGINCKYCENENHELDPNRTYLGLSADGFAELTAREEFSGLPCNGEGGDDSGNNDSAATHYMFDGRTYIEINDKYCTNDEGFTDPNVTYMSLDQAAFDALTSKPNFSGAPCNVLVDPPPDDDGDGGIAYLAFDGRTYIEINGKYCGNDPGFVDDRHTYVSLSTSEFAILSGREEFSGLPCNDPGSNDDNDGGDSDISYFQFDGQTYIEINGKYCGNDPGFVDDRHTYIALNAQQFGELTEKEEFSGLPCNDPGNNDGGDGGGDEIAYLSFEGRTYIRIGGKYCSHSDGFVDPSHTYEALSAQQFAALTAMDEFSGLPCQ